MLSFIHYLKSSRDINAEKKDRISPDFEHIFNKGPKNKNSERSKNALVKILNKHLHDLNHDLDDQAALDWQNNYFYNRDNLIQESQESRKKKARKNYFNLEINPHSHIKIFDHEYTKKNLSPIKVSWQFKLATLVVIAFILSVAIAELRPTLADRIARWPDKVLTQPIIKLTYLYQGESALAKLGVDAPPEFQLPAPPKQIDKNTLSSYIINNQDKLNKDRILITREELDGRVAGVVEPSNYTPTPELAKLSEDYTPIRTKILDFLSNLLK